MKKTMKFLFEKDSYLVKDCVLKADRFLNHPFYYIIYWICEAAAYFAFYDAMQKQYNPDKVDQNWKGSSWVAILAIYTVKNIILGIYSLFFAIKEKGKLNYGLDIITHCMLIFYWLPLTVYYSQYYDRIYNQNIISINEEPEWHKDIYIFPIIKLSLDIIIPVLAGIFKKDLREAIGVISGVGFIWMDLQYLFWNLNSRDKLINSNDKKNDMAIIFVGILISSFIGIIGAIGNFGIICALILKKQKIVMLPIPILISCILILFFAWEWVFRGYFLQNNSDRPKISTVNDLLLALGILYTVLLVYTVAFLGIFREFFRHLASMVKKAKENIGL